MKKNTAAVFAAGLCLASVVASAGPKPEEFRGRLTALAVADAADANGVKLKVTGIAVVDDTYEGKRGAKFLPPETRVVVPSDKQLALFRVEYDVPTNMNVRIFLEQNGDPKGFSCNFGTSGSALYSGAGVGARILHLDGKNYLEDGDLYDYGVLVKSVRLSCYGEDDGAPSKARQN